MDSRNTFQLITEKLKEIRKQEALEKEKITKLNTLRWELPYSVGQLIEPPFSREQFNDWCEGKTSIPYKIFRQICELNTFIEVKKFEVIDSLSIANNKEFYSVYFHSNWEFEEYDPETYKIWKHYPLYETFIRELNSALRKIGYSPYTTLFKYEKYDSWLNITGRKNNTESLSQWAKKQEEEGVNFAGDTPEEAEKCHQEFLDRTAEILLESIDLENRDNS